MRTRYLPLGVRRVSYQIVPGAAHWAPRQPYFVVSKVDNKKKLYLDSHKVQELVYAKADEMGVVI